MPTIQDLQKEVIKPGIYFNMDDEVYHADKSISNSGMSDISKTPRLGLTIATPRKYWYESNFNPNKEKKEKKSYKLGRAFHLYMLEPHKFHECFKIKPKVKTTKEPGYITETQYENLKMARSSLYEDDIRAAAISNSLPEVSIFWLDEATGVPCRIKVDCLGLKFACDLKSTRDALDLGYSIVDYGYHRQAGFYLDGIRQIKKLLKSGKAVIEDCPDEKWLSEFVETEHSNFAFIFQEIAKPYTTNGIVLTPDDVQNGYERSQFAIQTYKEQYEKHGENIWDTGVAKGFRVMKSHELSQSINY